jgi:hypothetical protein
MIIAVVFGILLLGGVGFLVVDQSAVGSDGDVTDVTKCNVDTSVSFNVVNGLSKGTAVAESQTVRVNGGNPGAVPTNLIPGDELEYLLNASNFIDKTGVHTVTCGPQTINDEMFATSTNTFTIFNSVGNVLSDAAGGGTTNQSALGSGGAEILDIEIKGTDKESTGDLVVVVEHTNQTGCDTITLSGLGGAATTDVPDLYSVSGANAKAFAYDVPAVEGATKVTGALGIAAKSGQICSGSIYVTAYSKQAFADTDGTFVTGVENADDVIKYEDTWDFDFNVAA